MRLISWNVRGVGGIGRARRAHIVDAIAAQDPDVAILQEVCWAKSLHEDLISRLRDEGLEFHVYGGEVGSTKKRYGILVVSKHRLKPYPRGWAPGVPWEQSLVRAKVKVPEGDFDVVGVHIPNGSGNGWKKIESFEALGRGLSKMPENQLYIVAGDFNEPRALLPDGTVVPFAMKYKPLDGSWTSDGMHRGILGNTYPRERWRRGVLSILGERPSYAIRHAFRGKDGQLDFHATHVVNAKDKYRFLDHVLVSKGWRVNKARFNHDVRGSGTSDHSMAIVDLSRTKKR